MSKSRHVVRKVKNGKVKIFNRYFEPEDNHMKYNGMFDGKKMMFGLYYDVFGLCNLVSLMGEVDESGNIIDVEPVNGCLPWLFWRGNE